ncbi:MAG: ankyrin repeat domain-containing protein [Planctomycetota bacterium]
MAAAGAGALPVVERLLVAGADAKAVAGPAMSAAAGHADVLARLVAAGAPVDARAADGATAFLAAASLGAVESVRWLLAHGADRAARDGQGRDAGAAMDAAVVAAQASIAAVRAKRGVSPDDERDVARSEERLRGIAAVRALLAAPPK